MICLTGDIHHQSLGTGNQKLCDITEVETAVRFLELLRERNIKVTFFITGRCFREQWGELSPIAFDPLVEVGGHTYNCFEPAIFHRVWNKLTGNYNGPGWYQHQDIRKTVEIIKKRTGRHIRCWRNHMYMHGPKTDVLLYKSGVELCSDGVKRLSRGPERHPSGIFNLPINIIPDHEHIYHAERTREWVDRWLRRYNFSDDFGPESYEIERWGELVIEGLRHNERRGAISTLIIHPITMYLADGFQTVERILDYIADRKTLYISELLGPEEWYG